MKKIFQYQLFLGLTKGCGTFIKNCDIDKFIDNNVLKYINNFTITKNIGYYNGKKEESITILIISEDNIYNSLKNIAKLYKEQFNQESVILSCQKLNKYELYQSKK